MRAKQVLIAIDQLLNAMTGGWADETLSARCWRRDGTGKLWSATRKTIDTIFFWQEAHCMEAWLSEVYRRQLPPEYRLANNREVAASERKRSY